ncbi:MAG TPA: NUDIX hydrolase [Rhodospirillaceae bacterium]|nr:NUDIX hydrolase [Rhodospirillaceae bacterium]
MAFAKGKKRKKRALRQYAALPYTVRDGELLVLLVTSRETGRWVIPKGWLKKQLKPSGTAAAEAFEEAGVRGDIARKPIASFEYSKRLSDEKRRRCRVDVFLLAVHEELDDWPEKSERRREWMPPTEAADCVTEAGLVSLLLAMRLEG